MPYRRQWCPLQRYEHPSHPHKVATYYLAFHEASEGNAPAALKYLTEEGPPEPLPQRALLSGAKRQRIGEPQRLLPSKGRMSMHAAAMALRSLLSRELKERIAAAEQLRHVCDVRGFPQAVKVSVVLASHFEHCYCSTVPQAEVFLRQGQVEPCRVLLESAIKMAEASPQQSFLDIVVGYKFLTAELLIL